MHTIHLNRARGGTPQESPAGRPRRTARLLRRMALAPAVCLVLTASGDGSQAAKTFLEQRLVDHAPVPATLRVVYAGRAVMPDQSRRPTGPHDAQPRTVRIALDEAAGAFSFAFDARLDGGLRFPLSAAFLRGKGHVVDYAGTYEEVSAPPTFADAYLPHLLLRTVLRSGRALQLSSGGGHRRVDYSTPGGARNRLVFDARTGLLAAFERAPVPSVFGDERRVTRFEGYRRVGQTAVPRVIVQETETAVLGRTAARIRLQASRRTGPTPAETALPTRLPRRDAGGRAFEALAVAPDLYLLRNVGTAGLLSYNVMAALIDHEVAIIEPALDDATSRRVLDAVGRLFPGKPVRWVVLTHHHGDHIGGIRPYIALGATIIAPRGSRQLIARLPGSAGAPAPLAPRVEEVGDHRVVGSGAKALHLHDLPSSHAAHMLVAYWPAPRILYQGDLVNAGEIAPSETTDRFLGWLGERGLPAELLVGTHGRTLDAAQLARLRAERRAPAARAGR